MKKYALSFILYFLFFIPFMVFSQVKVGLHAGLGNVISDYRGDLDLSLNCGLTVDVPISKSFFIHTGIAYNDRSLDTRLFSDSEPWDVSSWVFPAACKWGLNWNGGQLYLKGGGFIGVLANPEFNYGRQEVDFVPVEYGGLIGGGLMAKLDWGGLFMEFESRFGFNDLTNKDDSYDIVVVSTEFLRFGLMFSLGVN